MNKDKYLALLFQAHFSNFRDDLQFWKSLASKQGEPILELGCGSGRVIKYLAGAGHSVYGLDADANPLKILKNDQSAVNQSEVCLWQGDLARFRLEKKFALIILPCNTFSALRPEDRKEALESVRHHLEDKGLFAASIPNPAVLERLPASGESEVEQVFPHPLDGEPVQVSSTWHSSDKEYLFQWHYDHLLPDGQVKRISTEVTIERSPVETYMSEIRESGMHIVSTLGDFDHSPYKADSPYWIVTAQIA